MEAKMANVTREQSREETGRDAAVAEQTIATRDQQRQMLSLPFSSTQARAREASGRQVV